jgi:hypothetical protein
MTKIKIDTGPVRAAGDTLSALPEPLSSVGSSLVDGNGLMSSEAGAGYDDFAAAWSAALDLLAQDATYVASKARAAADAYERTCRELGRCPR